MWLLGGDNVLRKVIDNVKPEQGEALVDVLRSSRLCLVNGRVGQDNFTCFWVKDALWFTTVWSSKENLVSQFQVKTMTECEEEGCVDFEAQRVPDHSVLMWSLALAGSGEVHAEKVKNSDAEGGTNRHLVVPRDYLSGKGAAIDWITEEFQIN